MARRLTLTLEPELIESARRYAKGTGRSVSELVADYFRGLTPAQPEDGALPPITRSLYGCLAGTDTDEQDYRDYLEAKYL